MKHKAPQTEFAGAAEVFNLAGEVIKQQAPKQTKAERERLEAELLKQQGQLEFYEANR